MRKINSLSGLKVTTAESWDGRAGIVVRHASFNWAAISIRAVLNRMKTGDAVNESFTNRLIRHANNVRAAIRLRALHFAMRSRRAAYRWANRRLIRHTLPRIAFIRIFTCIDGTCAWRASFKDGTVIIRYAGFLRAAISVGAILDGMKAGEAIYKGQIGRAHV